MTGTPTLRWYLFGLIMTMTTLETTMANETMTLTGYLCDHPDRVQDYRVLPFNQSACWAPKTEAKPEGMYSIVQKQTYALAEGTKCVKTISRFTFVCTHNLVAAHQRLARVPEIEVGVKVRRDECHMWVTTGQYQGPDGRQHRVDMERTTVMTFYEAGRQEVSGSSIICEGERVKVGDRLIEGVAILEQVKVTLERRNFRFEAASPTEATVQVQEDHIELPCVGLLHYCETSEATYIWNEIQSTQYQLVQTVRAEMREEEGQQVLISTEKKIRLVLGDVETQEGRSYRATKYENIFVCEGVATYLDSISSNHLRLVAWVAARDDYLSWALENRIMETYDIVSNQRCHREQDMLKNQMATSFTSPEGFHHLHLGENRFGALIGEVLYEYTCTPVTVQPRRTKRCTQELPVTWEQKNFFLEPISRLMKTYGNVVPCSQLLETKFLTLDGRWLTANPELKYTASPRQFMDSTKGLNWSHIDMASGGLYTPVQLEDFQRLLDYPRAKKVVADHMVHEVCQGNDNEMCEGFNRILKDNTLPGLMWNWKSETLKLLHEFGVTCAAIIGVYWIGSFFMWIAGCIWSCRTLQGVRGRRRWIQPLLPTKWVVNYDYGAAARAARADMDKEHSRQVHDNDGVELAEADQFQPRTDERALLYPSLKKLQGREEQDQKILRELQEDPGFDKA